MSISPNVIVYLFASIILIWITSLTMIDKKKIILLLPFWIMGVLFSFQSGFIFYSLFKQIAWFFIEIVMLVCLLWIFIILRRENVNN